MKSEAVFIIMSKNREMFHDANKVASIKGNQESVSEQISKSELNMSLEYQENVDGSQKKDGDYSQNIEGAKRFASESTLSEKRKEKEGDCGMI
ncbi:hypothetical protein AgCh_023074 [Apium graveolens]